MKILGGLLLVASLLLPAETAFAAGFPVGTPVYDAAPGQKLDPAVASDGTDFLVVWRDGRGGYESLLAARVTAGGEILDPLGIPIAIGALAQAPRVVWTGSAYAIVWQRSQNGETPSLMAALVDRDGRVIAAPRRIVSEAWSQQGRFVATNGSRILVGYTRFMSGGYSDVRIAVLDTNLNPIDDHRVALPDVARSYISIAANGGKFMAVWSANRGPSGQIEAVRLDENGTPIDTQPHVISTGVDPELASDGTKFMVLVRVMTNQVLTQSARTVDLDYDRTDLQALPEGQDLYLPTLIWTGSKYLVIAQKTGGAITATDIEADGTPVATRTITTAQVTGMSPTASAATNGSRLLVTWLESTDQNLKHAIRARVFDVGSLAPASDELLMTRSANEQNAPSVAFDGGNHLVVWTESTGIYATRVSPNGVSLDGRGVQLTPIAAHARVIFDGTNYLVAWPETSSVVARYVGTDGVPGTELRVPAEAPTSKIALADGNASTLLAWSDTHDRVMASRISHTTHTISSPIAITPSTERGGEPAAAWNGTEFLVAWTDLEESTDIVIPGLFPARPRIRGTRLTRFLSVRDPNPLVLADLRETEDLYPSLASNGTDWLLAWQSEFQFVYTRRIRANGSADEPVLITSWGMHPSAFFDGTKYVVAYRRHEDSGLWPIVVTELPSMRSRVLAASDPVEPYAVLAEDVALSGADAGLAVAHVRWSWRPEHAGVDRVFLNVAVRKMRAVR